MVTITATAVIRVSDHDLAGWELTAATHEGRETIKKELREEIENVLNTWSEDHDLAITVAEETPKAS
jgi:hypothetical protein